MLIFIRLSDTIDHNNLLLGPQNLTGIKGTALMWFSVILIRLITDCEFQ